MSDTEPGGSDAEIVALLRACGMDEASLDDGVRNVRKIVRKKTAAARGTEPLDLDAADALIAETDKHLGNVHNCSILKDRHDDLIERLGTTLAATIAEVRRLRDICDRALVAASGVDVARYEFDSISIVEVNRILEGGR